MKNPVAKVAGILVAVSILAVPAAAHAHVTVAPSEVVASSRQTFAVSVPNERDVPVVAVRLVLPEGLGSVRPHAKPGWSVDATTSGEGESVTTTEIVWTSSGEDIPVKLKDEFLFSARVIATEGTLGWKAYETYADGTVVAWDGGAESQYPASVSKIMTEPAAAAAAKEAKAAAVSADKSADRALYVALAALALSVVFLALAVKSKN